MSFESEPNFEKLERIKEPKAPKIKESKTSERPEERIDLVNNVATEMLETYLEHWLPPEEHYKKVWLDDNLGFKDELIEMIAKEVANDYKLIKAKMLTKEKVKKDLREDFIPRKINMILKKNGVV